MKDMKIILEEMKAELEKLSTVKNKVVKEALTVLNEKVLKLEEIKIPEEATEKKVEEKEESEEKDESEESTEETDVEAKEDATEEVKDESEEKEESDVEENAEEDSKEEVAKDEKPVESEKKDDVQLNAEPVDKSMAIELSKEVAGKLEEASIELNKLHKEIDAKTDIIDGYKNKIIELQKEIKTYKETEQLELDKQFDMKSTRLIELYSKLKVSKTKDDFQNFSEDQLDKLIIDLSAMQNSVSRPVRQTVVSASLELDNYNKIEKKKELTAADTAKTLFFD